MFDWIRFLFRPNDQWEWVWSENFRGWRLWSKRQWSVPHNAYRGYPYLQFTYEMVQCIDPRVLPALMESVAVVTQRHSYSVIEI